MDIPWWVFMELNITPHIQNMDVLKCCSFLRKQREVDAGLTDLVLNYKYIRLHKKSAVCLNFLIYTFIFIDCAAINECYGSPLWDQGWLHKESQTKCLSLNYVQTKKTCINNWPSTDSISPPQTTGYNCTLWSNTLILQMLITLHFWLKSILGTLTAMIYLKMLILLAS